MRESTNFPGDYTLCVSCDGKVEHYRIIYLKGKLTIDDELYFENLMQLVEVRCFLLSFSSVRQRYCVLAFALIEFRCAVHVLYHHVSESSRPCGTTQTRVPGTKNEQEVSKRKSELYAEVQYDLFRGKTSSAVL